MTTPSASSELPQHLALVCSQFSRLAARRSDVGVGTVSWRVVATIDRHGPLRLSDIAERERADADPSALPDLTAPAQLADLLARMLEAQSGPLAARTRARYALFLEIGADEELAAPLRRQRAAFETWTERITADVGIPDPVPAARALMALCDGLLLHRLTVDPSLEVRPVLERAVRDLARN